METVAPDRDLIHQAPKVVLHDHLDGGLRPTTVVELADLTGYRDLPTTDPAELAAAKPRLRSFSTNESPGCSPRTSSKEPSEEPLSTKMI